ncbi:MAG TPA: methyl-accepting chemotaxis protein [Rhodocyclaceae bacterium]
MTGIFSPATALMDRLRYRDKFNVLGLVALAAIGFILFNLVSQLNRVIDDTSHELAGVQAVRPLNTLVQALQQHRGLASGVLSGNEGMKPKLEEKGKDADARFAEVEALLPAKAKAGEAWGKLKADWAQLHGGVLALAPPESFARHTRLIGDALVLQIAVADETLLTLDPEIGTHYLIDTVVVKLPAVLERLGQMRARGTGILTKKEISDAQKAELSGLLGELDSTLRQQRINLSKVGAQTPALQAQLDKASADLSAGMDGVTGLVREDIIKGAFATDPKDYFARVTAVIDQGYEQAFKQLMPALEQQINLRQSQTRREFTVLLLAAALACVVFCYLAVGAYLAMSRAVVLLEASASRIAGGDLTASVAVSSKDELGDVAAHFNAMAQSVKRLIGSIKEEVRRVNDAAVSLATASNEIRSGTERQSAAASNMAAAVEEMSVSVDQISGNAASAREIALRSGELSQQGVGAVEAMIVDIDSIAQTVADAAAVVQELGGHSEQISAIVNVIREIADQTNLLALNAAIEAARAGESGRGFAVVADEVRKLAERTAQSTAEISTMVAAIQSGTQTAVATMGQGVSRVQEGVSRARDTGAAIAEIRAQADQAAQMVAEISVALREQTTAGADLAHNIEHVAHMAEENTHAVAGNASTAQDLTRLARELDQAMARFTV